MPTLFGSFCRVDLADGVHVAMADSTTVRVVPARADLAADVARLERALADLTRECGRLRAQLEAAHRAACEGVDRSHLSRWESERCDHPAPLAVLWSRDLVPDAELDALVEQLRADRAGQRQRAVLATPEGALGATMQRATTMLSGGIHALLDGHVSPSERADLRPELAALATMIRRTLRAWDAADAGAEVVPLKRTGGAR